MPFHPKQPFTFLLPAVAMMLGWGLRGFIGGGPFGAMIPGAMVALCLCLLSKRQDAAMIAAFAAVGVGIGGEMTYGQTVGFIVHAETFWWGFLGLALKGGIWGLVAGAIIGMAFTPSTRLVVGGSIAMAVATQIGWKFFNQPKLVYFSNLNDKPRAEIWFGFLLAGLALLVWLGYQQHLQPALRLALAGFVGGFIGFGFGGAIQGVGRIYFPHLNLHWWKYMEFFFGFCFGWAIAWAWRHSDLPEAEPLTESPPAFVELAQNGLAPANGVSEFLQVLEPRRSGLCAYVELPAAAILTTLTFWLSRNVGTRFTYLLIGGAILILLTRFRWLAWHVALTTTFAATMLDSARYWSYEYKRGSPEPAYGVAIFLSICFGWLVRSWVRNDTFRALELITWACVADATFKFAMDKDGLAGLVDHIAVAFILMAIATSFMARKVRAQI